jgi:hypothetical protein
VDHARLKTEFAGRGTIHHRGTLSQAAFHPSKMNRSRGRESVVRSVLTGAHWLRLEHGGARRKSRMG